MKNFFAYIYAVTFSMILITGCSKINSNKTNENPAGNKVDTSTNKSGGNSAGVKEGEAEFNLSYAMPREIYRIEKEDLNSDGTREVIVLSVSKDASDKYNDFYNFDMIEVFALDSTKKFFSKILSDTVDYSKDYSFQKLGSDPSRQIIITTNYGGNNDVASKGMVIYDMPSQHYIKLVKYFDTGAPEIKEILDDGKKEILVSDIYYGVMPQVSAINFVKEIYKFQNGDLVQSNREFAKFYDDKIKELLEKYYGMKRKVEMGMQLADLSYPLYREAAEVVVNFYAKGDIAGLKKFWDEEKDSLKKNIPNDEYTDLSNFVSKVLPTTRDA